MLNENFTDACLFVCLSIILSISSFEKYLKIMLLRKLLPN